MNTVQREWLEQHTAKITEAAHRCPRESREAKMVLMAKMGTTKFILEKLTSLEGE